MDKRLKKQKIQTRWNAISTVEVLEVLDTSVTQHRKHDLKKRWKKQYMADDVKRLRKSNTQNKFVVDIYKQEQNKNWY